jgi:hypothetical protein
VAKKQILKNSLIGRSFLRSDKILLQNCAILRNALRKRNDELPSGSNGMQSSENGGTDFKSAASGVVSLAQLAIFMQKSCLAIGSVFGNNAS